MVLPALPVRPGDRPQTGPSVPHIQLSQNSPGELRAELRVWMTHELVAGGATIRRSEISEPGSLAFFLPDGAVPPGGAVLLPPRLDAEFLHLHTDGSLHLALSSEDQAALIATGWGERHPLYSRSVNVVMLYGPRTAEEFAVAKTVIGASYRYATGRDLAALAA